MSTIYKNTKKYNNYIFKNKIHKDISDLKLFDFSNIRHVYYN